MEAAIAGMAVGVCGVAGGREWLKAVNDAIAVLRGKL